MNEEEEELVSLDETGFFLCDNVGEGVVFDIYFFIIFFFFFFFFVYYKDKIKG